MWVCTYRLWLHLNFIIKYKSSWFQIYSIKYIPGSIIYIAVEISSHSIHRMGRAQCKKTVLARVILDVHSDWGSVCSGEDPPLYAACLQPSVSQLGGRTRGFDQGNGNRRHPSTTAKSSRTKGLHPERTSPQGNKPKSTQI